MKKIKDLREERREEYGDLTQIQLAAALNVTQASISRWEQDQLSISGKNLIKLSKYFKVSVDSLLGIE